MYYRWNSSFDSINIITKRMYMMNTTYHNILYIYLSYLICISTKRWNIYDTKFLCNEIWGKITWNNVWTTTYNASMVAESRSSWTPWVSITQPQAITECNSLWAWYHLITNNEWMTIARNIEANSQNWANWTVGSLVSAWWWLYRWNVNLNDSASCGANTPAQFCNTWSITKNAAPHLSILGCP